MLAPTERPPVELPPGVPDAGVITDARVRERRHRAFAAIAIASAVLIATLLTIGNGGRRPGLAHHAGGSSPASATRSPTLVACTPPRTAGKPVHGTPNRSLLSILGVLRQSATPADALPTPLLTGLLARPVAGIFVDYIRLAGVIGAIDYWVYPELWVRCEGRPALQVAVSFGSPNGTLVGSTTGGGTATSIEDARGYGASGGPSSTMIQMLVPDRVATVVLRYPAGKVGGFDHHHAAAVTITTNIVGNLMVVTVPRAGDRATEQMTMTWRAANGTTIKTFHRL